MDFYKIKQKLGKNKVIEVYPDFKVCRSKDLMVKGRAFYAVWNEEAGLWSTDEYMVPLIIDKELLEYSQKMDSSSPVSVKYCSDFSSKTWMEFRTYVTHVSDSSSQLDNKLTFSNTEVSKKDYVSKRLAYPLEKGDYSAWDEMMSTLYEPEERAKLEWAIGSIIAGDSKTIQKFVVLYGDPGAGKGTVLNIIQKLFDGYYTVFDAKALASNNNAFSTEAFRSNPLVAIQHDGDLSRIEDNTKLNSIVSHEEIIINEKYKSSYSQKINCFLFMASNKPVKITDGKSGIIRRLIDVHPSGKNINNERYLELMDQIDFQLSGIAYHCLEVYRQMGKNYYSAYRPIDMIYKTDQYYNFVEDSYDIFKSQDGTSLKQAYSLYKKYCDETNADYKLQMYKFREELKNYFEFFYDDFILDDKHVRSYYSGFKVDKFERDMKAYNDSDTKAIDMSPNWIILKKQASLLDDILKDCLAQYATAEEKPMKAWSKVTSTLYSISSDLVHYVKVPINHIVIDFDIKDNEGKKSLALNLEAAKKWPKTYAEVSKSGQGLHLHYIYSGDVNQLARQYDKDIEIKVFTGKSSLRRKLTMCNDIPVATISSGLPIIKEKKMLSPSRIKSEKKLREMIKRNLNKEIHGFTAPSVSFIKELLDQAYASGMNYDVSDMKPAIMSFAMHSTHQSANCLKLVMLMKFKSEDASDNIVINTKPITFFDIEVFPNLLLVNFKQRGKDSPMTRWINPRPSDIEWFINSHRLIGFNNRRYDNHILYARMMGYELEDIFKLSQRIVAGNTSAMITEAYNISYADVYDISSKKQSLKKFEIELGIHHQELGLPWDQPVPEHLWNKVSEYCDNDVYATEAVFDARHEDFVAREILADLSGLTINDTTRQHTTKIIFQGDKHPDLVYTDLSEMFPGYKYENGHSFYRGEDPGEGGYVYAEPGMYGNVILLDVASMHPTSIEQLNLFGSYTVNFSDIKTARLLIKHHEYEKAAKLFEGRLAKYLTSEDTADALAQALKIVINSVYGYTTATFDNPFKDPRNIDNIVAKRGALFMINLKHEVQDRGYTVAHIKTDSIKIPDGDDEIIAFVKEYGQKYGYIFEHEATYEKMCLVNDAVYIAKYKGGKHDGEWTATGAQFQVPYVFKTLFSKEQIEFDDLCETKSTTSSLYLDFNEDLPDGEHNYQFVGKVGRFCPIIPGKGGGELFREKDGKYYAVTGTKGYRWKESESVLKNSLTDNIDISYYQRLAKTAIDTINEYGDYEWFSSSDPYIAPPYSGSKIVKS